MAVALEPDYREIDQQGHADPGMAGVEVLGLGRLAVPGRGMGRGVLDAPDLRGPGGHRPRQPTMWAVYITNFVFWVGIAHSGTLISAILYSVPQPLAHRGVSHRRDHDRVRGHDRRPVPADPSGPGMVLLLAAAVSQPALAATRFPLAPGVGRIRGQHLSDRQRAVPLHGPDPRRGDGARRVHRMAQDLLRRRWRSDGRARTTNGAISPAFTCCWPDSPRRW